MTQQGPTQQQGAGVSKIVGGVVAAVALAGAVGVGLLKGGNPDAGPAPNLAPVASTAPIAAGPDSSAGGARVIDFSKICQGGSGATVPTGTASEADAYYAAAAQEIGLVQFGTLDAILTYLGYPLGAKRLQDAAPSELMDPSALHLPTPPAAGAVLAARFFAPKITDVSQTNTPATKVGWRKLVRFRPMPGSAATTNGIEAAFVLFNFFAPIKASAPFDGADSVNTQVVLATSKSGMSPIYWFDYGPTSGGALLSKELDAFFDAGHTPDNGGKRSYFVPCGCISCHGGLQLDFGVTPPAPTWDPDKALLNYLDTDHWFDRIQPGEDFSGLAAPVLFDQGAFDVIRALNQEMRDQNQRVQPGSAEQRAASHWVDIHSANPAYISRLVVRALAATGDAGAAWNGADSSDVAALKGFNHYCFRCHGSVEFDVFDRSMVLALRGPLLSRLQPRGTLADPRATMPPDRDMNDADRAALRSFLLAH